MISGNYVKATLAQALLILALASLCSFALHTKKKPKDPLPPGCLEFSPNLYGDQHEITNMAYREYLYYLKNLLGPSHPAFETALPDTSVFHALPTPTPPGFYTTYFSQADYAEHPVLGLSWEQALAYSYWRSEMVFKQLLLKQKKLAPGWENTPLSISGYFTARMEGITLDTNLRIPYYSLPSPEDLLAMEKHSKAIHNSQTSPLPYHCRGRSKKKGFYGLSDNVSEMTGSTGKAYGGNFLHGKSSVADAPKYYEKPAVWLGFRNVCRWITWTEYRTIQRSIATGKD